MLSSPSEEIPILDEPRESRSPAHSPTPVKKNTPHIPPPPPPAQPKEDRSHRPPPSRSLNDNNAPPPPPPPAAVSNPTPERSALLDSIKGFKQFQLRPAQTNDRSSPLIDQRESTSQPSGARGSPHTKNPQNSHLGELAMRIQGRKY